MRTGIDCVVITLRFTLSIDGLDDESLVVRGFEGKESLSDSDHQSVACFGFRYSIDIASRNSDLTPDQVVDRNAELAIFQSGELVQRLHGVVSNFIQGDIGHHHTFYSLTLVPAFERLSLRHNSRIFQQQSCVDIVSTLLQEMGINDFSFALKRPCLPREFCVQYRESDLDFVQRLAAEEGWVYSFMHESGKHVLIFSDDTVLLPRVGDSVPYNGLAGGVANCSYIYSFIQRTQREVAQVQLRDYSFKKPEYSFAHQQSGNDMAYQRENYEHYDYPGRYKDDANGKAFSQIRMEYLRRDAHIAIGQSNQPQLRAGYRFALEEHLNIAMNRDWLVVEITHKGTQPQALEESGGEGATTYSNTFKVIPSSQTWRATPQSKPQVDGPMIATVVGPQGEEIFCDKHGRVKVHFPWDRESKKNEYSSCWVRVSQVWAGGQYGLMAIPRIGHEVIVSFLNGDPDQPIITGQTYHATNVTPYILPNHKTRTVIKTQTHQGSGYNELRFEDEASREQIFIHAQKDKDVVINNISRELVGVDWHQKIGRWAFQMIGENSHRIVGKNVTEEFGQDHHYTVGRNLVQRIVGAVNRYISGGVVSKIDGSSVTAISASEEKKIGSNQRVAVCNESYLNASDIVLEAKKELTIKGPGGFVKIDSSGITISGNVVKINDGGSPGAGSAPQPRDPEQPDKPKQPDEPDRRS